MKHLKRLGAALIVALTATLAIATPTYALGVIRDQVISSVVTVAGIDITWPTPLQITTIVSTVALPALVGLVANSNWSTLAKYVLHLALSAVAGIVAELLELFTNGGSYDLTAALVSAVITFGLGVLAYKSIGKAESKNGRSIASALAAVGEPKHRQ